MLELRAETLADTHAIAAAIARASRPGDVIVLSGEMGAGKTAFAQGFGAALGVTEPITSPTFTLVHTYRLAAGAVHGAAQLHHADLYRLDRMAEVADLALDELADDRGIVLVEWGEVADAVLGDHLVVHLSFDDVAEFEPSGGQAGDGTVSSGGTVRLIEVSASGPAWANRWGGLVAACEAFRC